MDGRSIPSRSLTLTQADRLALGQGDLATIIFERVFRQLQGNLANTSDVPLETDILRDDKKRELLFLALRTIEDVLDSLRRASLPPGQLPEKAPTVLQDIWTEVITDFFGRYYTLQIDNLEQPVVPTLMAELDVVRESILNKIPQVPMLLGHLLFQEPLVIDGSAYVASTPEAMDRSQMLLEHLLIQLANAVMQPLLNQFGDVELLKKNLYQRRMMTSRDIARFRNELSWRYRWDQLVKEPTAIFESQYRLFGFTERGIQARFIYAPPPGGARTVVRSTADNNPGGGSEGCDRAPIPLSIWPGGQRCGLRFNRCDWARHWADWAWHFTGGRQHLERPPLSRQGVRAIVRSGDDIGSDLAG